MKRRNTEISVWPAITDLMTVLAILGLTAAVVVASVPANGCLGDLQECRDRKDSLQTVIVQLKDGFKRLRQQNEELRDSLIQCRDSLVQCRKKCGIIVPCLGRDEEDNLIAIATIFLLGDDQYRLERVGNQLDTLDLPLLKRAVNQGTVSDVTLKGVMNELKDHSPDCWYVVYVYNGGVEDDTFLIRRIKEIQPYVLPGNPSRYSMDDYSRNSAAVGSN